ncbi:hypothetical protein A6P39_006630 [Streptomyces sp. FXJ1.172]|uniref:hypothetical protein n=1 Tax=Streptomyces sp. FXJ1.172 TaxID=710705 RepID=UPI0007CF5FB9|nr:hypothetical protein [Streptomyces sp. FXJ1.172]WEO93710.1 hypothetical protein A6P39_006630 [Streptomyces sp. FXJ1.172]
MVTETPRATTAPARQLLAQAQALRTDADLMDGYARRLTATAATLRICPAAPGWIGPTLEQQVAACVTAAEQLRAAAEALLAHNRA